MKRVSPIDKRVFTTVCAFFLSFSFLYAQTAIHGSVIDATGEPIIGAAVQVKNSTVGTITDFDGNFTLQASSQSTDRKSVV